MWTDPWIPDHPPRPPRAVGEVQLGEHVKDYLDPNTKQWNEQMLRQFVIEEDVQKIMALKVSPLAQQDLLGWHYNEDGLYTVRSG